MDTKQVSLGAGKVVYQFGALDCFTRKRVVGLARSLSSQQGADFLRRAVSEFPFPVMAIQSDGGSEFLGAFRLAAQELEHQALGYKTPEQFYQEWLTTHHVGKGTLSDMS